MSTQRFATNRTDSVWWRGDSRKACRTIRLSPQGFERESVVVLWRCGLSWCLVLVSGSRRFGLLRVRLPLLFSWSPTPVPVFARKGDVPRTHPVVFAQAGVFQEHPGTVVLLWDLFGELSILSWSYSLPCLEGSVSYRGHTPPPHSFVSFRQQ